MNRNDPDIEQKINVILERLTIDEKIGQLHQSGSYKDEEKSLLREGKIGSLLNFCGSDAVSGIQNTILGSVTKLPLLIGDDVIHGYSTGFPIPLAASCSFDLDLIEETSAIAAKEASSQGVNLIFAPMVDISRDPRWGRIAEGAGEDPYYGALVAESRVRGIQRLNERGYPQAAACPKHFVGYGAAEGGRDYDYTEISDITLYNTYLPPFRAAVGAGALAVMSSFNDVSGRPASLSSHLINGILREEMGFDGMVVSDWESVRHGIAHGIVSDDADAAEKGLKAGVDLDMNSGIYRNNIKALIENGKLTSDDLDDAVRRIIRTKFRLGSMDNGDWNIRYPAVGYKDDDSSLLRRPEYIKAARELAGKSIVLLKNSSRILPLSDGLDSIAVIGRLAVSKEDPLGCWQCKMDPENVVTILDGIKHKVRSGCEVIYAKGKDEAVNAAKMCDVAVVVLGEDCWMSGENTSKAFLDLPLEQKELLKKVAEANHRTVLVLMNGRPLTIADEAEVAGAVIEAWQLGDEMGNAVADVLFGDRNPSGRLTVSFPRSVGQIPVYYDHRSSGRPELIRYIDEQTSPLFPFGYGLSYSTFEYSNFRSTGQTVTKDTGITVMADVTNTDGPYGEEIVQMYIRDVVSDPTRPVREFKGFVRLCLAPGETGTASFRITEDILRYYGHDLRAAADKGLYRVFIGRDSNCESVLEFDLE